MNVLKEGKALAVNVVKDVIGHWKTPGGKNQVSYKEILNLGLGGMGQQFVLALTGYFGLSVGNTLIGSTIGITPMHIQYMSMIQTVLNVFLRFCAVRSWTIRARAGGVSARISLSWDFRSPFWQWFTFFCLFQRCPTRKSCI